MKLPYTICVPNITYACDIDTNNHKDKESMHVAVNDTIRKIYSYNRWESIKELHKSQGYLFITEIFAQRKLSFEQNLPGIGNKMLTVLSRV